LAKWITGTNMFVHGGGEIPAYLGASTGEVTTVAGATSPSGTAAPSGTAPSGAAG
jgi:hypothetical protein